MEALRMDQLAPNRERHKLRGLRYRLKSPMDFTLVQWLEINRDDQALLEATTVSEQAIACLTLMPQIFFDPLSEDLVRSMTLWEALNARESFMSGLSGRPPSSRPSPRPRMMRIKRLLGWPRSILGG